MAVCGFCDNEMNSGESCVEHEIVTVDWQNDDRIDVIDAPRHNARGSLVVSGQCDDCGVEPGGIHHPLCDNARNPDGSQVLIDSVEYRTDDQAMDGHNRLEIPVDGKAESYQFRANPDVVFSGVTATLAHDGNLDMVQQQIRVSARVEDSKVDDVLESLRLDEWDVNDYGLEGGMRKFTFTKEMHR